MTVVTAARGRAHRADRHAGRRPTHARAVGRPRCSTGSAAARGNRRTRRLRALLLLGAVLGSLSRSALLTTHGHAAAGWSSRRSTRASTSAASRSRRRTSSSSPSTTGPSQIHRQPTWPINAQASRQGDRASSPRPGAKVIAYDVPVHRAERQREGATTRSSRRSGRGAADGAEHDRGRAGGRTASLAAATRSPRARRCPANGNYVNDADGRDPPAAAQSIAQGLVTFPMAAARLARGHAIRAAHGRQRLDRLPGPAPTPSSTSASPTSRTGQFNRVGGQGQGRRRRRDGARRCRTSTRRRRRRRADARAGDPGRRDRTPRSPASRCAAVPAGSTCC